MGRESIWAFCAPPFPPYSCKLDKLERPPYLFGELWCGARRRPAKLSIALDSHRWRIRHVTKFCDVQRSKFDIPSPSTWQSQIIRIFIVATYRNYTITCHFNGRYNAETLPIHSIAIILIMVTRWLGTLYTMNNKGQVRLCKCGASKNTERHAQIA